MQKNPFSFEHHFGHTGEIQRIKGFIMMEVMAYSEDQV